MEGPPPPTHHLLCAQEDGLLQRVTHLRPLPIFAHDNPRPDADAQNPFLCLVMMT